jgi:hypothetical protein
MIVVNIVMAIAALCHIPNGSNDPYPSTKLIQKWQLNCQQEYIKCMSDGTTLPACILERKIK